MERRSTSEAAALLQQTTVERISDREVVVARSFNASTHVVFLAWTKVELFRQWWVPASFGMTLLACDMDVRVGGGYRLEFRHPASEQPMSFFGTYLEVVPNERLVWTNEEGDAGQITTVTFQESHGQTLVVVSDLYPTKDALDAEIDSGATGAMPEQFMQLDKVLSSMVPV